MSSRKEGARSSNLELMRIILMLIIIAHHYVVNSGITACFNFSNITANMIFLQIFGMGGKIAINALVMITGYFMCQKKFTWKRFLKLWLEVKFYKLVIYIIFCISGFEVFNFSGIFNCIFRSIMTINASFSASFLAFYIFIPFYNVLVERVSCKELKKLILFLLLIFTVSGTAFNNDNAFNEVGWYMTLYFIAAYVRLYPLRWMGNRKIIGSILVCSIILAIISILVIDYRAIQTGFTNYYYFVNNSHKILALVIGVSIFLFFKNLKIKQSKLINQIASTTFGVLLIHTNSATMRTFVWKGLHVTEMYTKPLEELVFHAVTSVIGIFVVCSVLDLLRICLLEKPLFRWIESKK